MGTWVDFKELRATLKFADVLSHFHVEVKVRGEKGMGFCPLPGHRKREDGKRHTPSFSVHLSRNIFQCFSCKASGNVLDFACLMSGGDPNDPNSLRATALKLQETFRMEHTATTVVSAPPAEKAEAKVEAPVTEPKKAAGPIVVNAPLDFELKHLDSKHPYLLSRGFTPETIEHFGLGYCSKGLMANRIAIPLHNAAGKLVGYAGRLVDDSAINAETPKYLLPGARERNGFRYEFHKSALLYNFHRIDTPITDLIVVEGFASTWWLSQCGLSSVVALMGASCSSEQGDLICRMLRPEGRVWTLSDGDDAGDSCAHSVFTHVGTRNLCRWVRLAKGHQPTDCTADDLSRLFAPLSNSPPKVIHAYRPERGDSD